MRYLFQLHTLLIKRLLLKVFFFFFNQFSTHAELSQKNLSLTFQILRVSGRRRKLKVLANAMVCILYIRNYFMCEDDQEGLYNLKI